MTPVDRKTLQGILARLTGLEPYEIKPEIQLLDEGLLTSLQVVELVAILEKDHHLQFLDEDVNPDNFHSLAAIEELLLRRFAGS